VAEIIRRKPYWRQTKLLMLTSLTLPMVLVAGLAYLTERFSGFSAAGMPLGFLLGVHGVAAVSIAAVARFSIIQERVDRWHGANDDA
jgi:putative solute:sodium symporter small subunit